MPESPLGSVVSHWHKLIENFDTSPSEFYDAVEAGLKRRQVPGIAMDRVTWAEGGLLSPHRSYVRVSGDRHTFDICAAPFGTGFFFSSWVSKKQARFVPLYLIAIGLLTLFFGWVLQQMMGPVWRGSYNLGLALLFGLFQLLASPLVLLPLAFLFVLLLVAIAARSGNTGPEAAILTVPFVGWFYSRFFAPETYYRIDTMLMFQSAVHAATLEAVDGLLQQKGLRALAADERKPVFREMLFAGGVPRAGLALNENGNGPDLQSQSPQPLVEGAA